jgi:hypothetical protein
MLPNLMHLDASYGPHTNVYAWWYPRFDFVDFRLHAYEPLASNQSHGLRSRAIHPSTGIDTSLLSSSKLLLCTHSFKLLQTQDSQRGPPLRHPTCPLVRTFGIIDSIAGSHRTDLASWISHPNYVVVLFIFITCYNVLKILSSLGFP